MNDLIKLLRGRRIDGRSADEIMRRAADEIERLRSRLADLEGALRIALNQDGDHSPTCECRLCEAEALLRKCRGEIAYQDGLLGQLTRTEGAEHPALADIDAFLAGGKP